MGTSKNVAAHPVAQLSDKDMLGTKPLQSAHRSLSPRTHPFHTIYDSVNRLQQAYERPDGWSESNCTNAPTMCWKQTFAFDRYSNRRFETSGGNTTTLPESFDPDIYNPTVSPGNNRFESGQGWSYDASGNVIDDPEGRSFTYDAENKQVKVVNSNSQIVGEYFFDGDGKRVRKVIPLTGDVTIFVYDATGKLLAEYATVVQPKEEAKVAYLTNDNLGTPRINSNAIGVVTSRSDYMPYGEQIVDRGGRSSAHGYIADDIKQGFTGYLMDDETELDFTQARMYRNSLGRFLSVDPVKLTEERMLDPQRINLYVYTRNNPTAFVDPTGRDVDFPRDKDGNLTKEGKYAKSLYDAYKKDIAELAAKDPAKYGSLVKTIEKLEASDVKFVVNVTSKELGEGSEAEGRTSTDGTNVLVTIRNIGNNHEEFPLIGRFAHELEHARQFEDGELNFVKTANGGWAPYPGSYDIYDELKAFKEQLKVSARISDTPTLAYLRRNDTNDADKATYLSRTYPNRKQIESNNQIWNYPPGTLVRPNEKHPSVFGRVHKGSK